MNPRWLATILLILLGCGVEVGNPKQPDPEPKVEITVANEDLALIAADSVNDVVNSSITIQDTKSESTSLQALQDPVIEISCEPSMAGTLATRSLSSIEQKKKEFVRSSRERLQLITNSSPSSPIRVLMEILLAVRITLLLFHSTQFNS